MFTALKLQIPWTAIMLMDEDPKPYRTDRTKPKTDLIITHHHPHVQGPSTATSL
jgi:hypothetical protein